MAESAASSVEKTSTQYLISQDQVRDRFIDSINRVPNLYLSTGAVRDHANGFAIYFRKRSSSYIRSTSVIFSLKEKIDRLRCLLPDLNLTHKEVFDVVDARKFIMDHSAETSVQKINALIDLVMEFKDPVVPIKKRPRIRSRRDAFMYIAWSCGDKMGFALETIDQYRRYATLVRDGKILHSHYAVGERKWKSAILAMHADELRERLHAYEGAVHAPVPKRPAGSNSKTEAGRAALAKMFFERKAPHPKNDG